jgi:hypothetical protein
MAKPFFLLLPRPPPAQLYPDSPMRRRWSACTICHDPRSTGDASASRKPATGLPQPYIGRPPAPTRCGVGAPHVLRCQTWRKQADASDNPVSKTVTAPSPIASRRSPEFVLLIATKALLFSCTWALFGW